MHDWHSILPAAYDNSSKLLSDPYSKIIRKWVYMYVLIQVYQGDAVWSIYIAYYIFM